ncbi:MAG: diaminopimelate epimerase [Kiritimatiellae bacterium]|jgi:diaminopimelate epimerase|nr:diaminopimelate epimerase [Kiritimatiellia bacterium]
MKFTKMHGTGNDFIVFAFQNLTNQTDGFFKKLSNRKTGIGCDQILAIDKSEKADFKISIWNSDGSTAQTCGNGLRALAKYVFDEKLISQNVVTFETPANINKATINLDSSNNVQSISVEMGKVILLPELIPFADKKNDVIKNFGINILDKILYITSLSVGNPHCVVFVEDFNDFDKYAPELEKSSFFPEKTNVEFVKVINSYTLHARVWERGAGETLSCGSGASAIAYASKLNEYTGDDTDVHMPGGILNININNNNIKLTGGATTVFNGEINKSWLQETKI